MNTRKNARPAEMPVTHPPQMTVLTEGPEQWALLAAGIDTLDLGLYIDWDDPEALFDRLDIRKQDTKGKQAVLFGRPRIGAALLHGGGRRMYRYHLELPALHLWLQATASPTDVPNGYVSFRAETLWLRGIDWALTQVRRLIDELGGTVTLARPSRVDLAVDYRLPGGLSLNFLRDLRVCRTPRSSHYFNQDRLETFYVGTKTGRVQARLYDKGEESRRKGKGWLLGLWNTEDCRDVWRIEFQVRRRALSHLEINSVADLEQKLGGLWDYLTARWLSFRLRDDSNTSRRTVHPWWAHVQQCGGRFGTVQPISHLPSRSASATLDWFVSHVAGCLPSFAAALNETNLEEALAALRDRVRRHWLERGDFEDAVITRIIRRGVDLGHPKPAQVQTPGAS